MTETRKLAAILAADVAGYSKLAGADEEQTLARLRALRSDLIAPTIALHHGRVVKRPIDQGKCFGSFQVSAPEARNSCGILFSLR
jgi:class 3 adenylate cyclase